MACVNAIALRKAAREAMFAAGGRGFVRFLPPGGALLATDANRRCRDEGEQAALTSALEGAGFVCGERNGLLTITPGETWLGMIAYDGEKAAAWDLPVHPVQALALRWLEKPKRELTNDGRQLIFEALRLSWQTPGLAKEGIEALRARAAVMQRTGDLSGMREAGAILLDWCRASQGGNGDEA